MPSYTCPACGVTLKTANPVAAGKKVKCPKCQELFAPEPEAAGGTLKLADPPPPPPPMSPARAMGAEEDDMSAYGVKEESAEEKEKADKNKVKYGELKFKKSARGPATALLVSPSNLLVFSGFATAVAGLVYFVVCMWPLVFSETAVGDDEMEEALLGMMISLMVFAWGAIVCYGASNLQSLESYTWALVGSIMGILPLFVGIYCLAMLRNPKVLAGFQETEGFEGDEGDQDGGDDDEEDDDD